MTELESRIRASFERQAFMKTLGARLVSVSAGEVVAEMDFHEELTQQHGFLHGGVVTSVLDSACGYAALTVMPETAGVLTVEFKVNLLAPADGKRFRAVGRVLRFGRTLTVCSGEMTAEGGKKAGTNLIAVMQTTMMSIQSRPGIVD